MNSEMLGNYDVVIRLLVLAVPVAAAFLFSIIYTMRAVEGVKELREVSQVFLAVCATNFFYAAMEVMIILFIENVTVEKVTGISVILFVIMGILNALSCIAKGIIAGKSMPMAVGADKQRVVSKALIYMSIAEIPGLIALVYYLLIFFT